jgi:hypothetical protein
MIVSQKKCVIVVMVIIVIMVMLTLCRFMLI